MPNWVTIKPASDNFSPSNSNVGGNWVTVKPAKVIPETPKEPTWTEKIGAFIGNAVRNPMETIDKAGNLIGGSIVNDYKDIVLQGESDKQSLSQIENNNTLVKELLKRKKENPAKASFYDEQIQKLIGSNNQLSEQSGGELKNKTDKQLAGQTLGTVVDVAGILAPVQGLFANAGKLAVSTAIKRYGPQTFGEIFKEGSRVIGQQGVEEMIKKGGGKISAEATDTIIKNGMESLGKQGLLKGDKLVSMQGLKNLATNPFVTEGAAYGAAQGLSGGMQQNESGMDLVKSTAEGTAYGVGGGVALHTAGKIITGATRGIIDSVSNKIAGKAATQEARDAISAAEELLGHQLGRTEKVQITKAVFKGATKDDITKNIINEADKAGVELDTTGIVKSTEPTVPKPENTIDDIMDIPAQERISREIASTEDPTVISEKLKGLVPEKDIPVVSEQLKNIDNPDDISRIIDGFNQEAIKDELSLRIATTDNPKKIASLLKGQVPDDDIPTLSQMMKGVEDEVTVKKMIDNANIPKPKAEVPKEVQPKMIERDMTEQEIATALAKKELSRYKETDSRFQANRKAVGMAYSSLKKRLEGNATAKELKKTRAYLESNYVGKEVTVDGKKGIVKKNAFGRPGVDFGNGKIKYFDAEKVKSKKVSDKEVYAKIIDDARKELDGKKKLYSISTKVSEPEKVAPVEKVTESKTAEKKNGSEDPLLQEAKKYSTPEEFVNGVKEIGMRDFTPSNAPKRPKLPEAGISGRSELLIKSTQERIDNLNIELSKIENSKLYQNSKNERIAAIKKDIAFLEKSRDTKIADIERYKKEMELFQDFHKNLTPERKVNDAISRGIITKEEGAILLEIEKQKITNPSQLTDIWKKAQGGKTLSDLGKEAIEALPRSGMSIQAVGGGKPTKFGSRVTPENRSNPSSYDQVTQQDILTKAKGNMKIGFDFALKQARNEKLGAEANATAMDLIDDAIKSEKWDTLDMLLKEFAPRFSKQGQEINILNRWGRLTPAGAVRYTQHIINKAVEATKQQIEFTPEAKQEIVALAEAVQNVEPGTREQTIAIAKLFGKIQEQIPTSFLRKVSTIQTMAQLLNPKTAIRNVIGNAGFAVGEAISDTAAVPIDMATSLFTGKRTKALPSLTTLGKGFGKGLREGAEEAGLGIDTKGLPGQFDMPTAPTFKGKVGSFFEKGLAYELKATDRAFYQASYDDSLRQQMKLAGISTPTPEMQEIAHADGLYRTFQDDSKAAWLFTKIKQGLNLGQDWGLGDIILKYPKTPGNLLSRAIEYSPAGYAKGLLEVAKPLVTKTPFNQKAFVEALSRGTVGSAGLVGMGFLLAKLGIITGEPSSDKDINALERSEGSGPYRLNASAAKRFLFGGDTTPKDGDLMVSYDWLQPFAVPLSIGANAQKDGATLRGSKNVAIESMTSGINTLAEQPLMQGMKRLFGYGDVAGGLSDTLSSAGASFVPTFLNQIRQLTDNTARETRGGSDMERALNTAKAKIPGLASDLPPQYTTLGEERETYQNGSNTWLNVFFNPAFVSRLESTPAGKEVMDIYQNSGETQQFPRVVPKTLEINNGESKEKLQLSNEQLSEYQKYVGERTKATFDKLASDQEFQKLADEEKAKYMADALSDINTAAKIELFGHKTSNSYVKGAAPYMNGTPGYETNETALSKQKLLLYKQRKDTGSWVKEADSLHKQYEKALEDKNLPEIDRVRITKDMEMLAGQLNKYKSYGGFTKPKKAKKISIANQKDSVEYALRGLKKLRPLRSYTRSRTNLASVSRPSIRRPKTT